VVVAGVDDGVDSGPEDVIRAVAVEADPDRGVALAADGEGLEVRNPPLAGDHEQCVRSVAEDYRALQFGPVSVPSVNRTRRSRWVLLVIVVLIERSGRASSSRQRASAAGSRGRGG